MVEQVEQPADKQDTEINDNKNKLEENEEVKEEVGIEFTE